MKSNPESSCIVNLNFDNDKSSDCGGSTLRVGSGVTRREMALVHLQSLRCSLRKFTSF